MFTEQQILNKEVTSIIKYLLQLNKDTNLIQNTAHLTNINILTNIHTYHTAFVFEYLYLH